MSPQGDDFEKHVFINCPFDQHYNPLRQALLFTLLDCGLEPRIASQRSDSGEGRMDKIRDLIKRCRFSVHDISRMEPLREGDLPRFNMPFELGLDLGCRYFGRMPFHRKQCLILEHRRFRYREVLSDLAGHDLGAHEGEPEILVSEVRSWLGGFKRNLPSGSSIWQRFQLCHSHMQLSLRGRGYTEQEIEHLPVAEYIDFVKEWLSRPGNASGSN